MKTGVYHRAAARRVQLQQRLLPQPPQEFVTIGGFEHVVESVSGLRHPEALRNSQEMQIMVAQNDARERYRLDEAQGVRGVGAAVDQIARQPQLVAGFIESQFVQQSAKSGVATLDITYGVGSHANQPSGINRRSTSVVDLMSALMIPGWPAE
jgi:hypothetical protein